MPCRLPVACKFLISEVPNAVKLPLTINEPVINSCDEVIVCTTNVCAKIVLVTVNEPVIVVLEFTVSPLFGSTEAVTLPLTILDKSKPTTPDAVMYDAVTAFCAIEALTAYDAVLAYDEDIIKYPGSI